MSIKEALKKYFGYSSFKPNQLEIINSILDGNNILAVLPTGAGKSLCYQIPSLVSENFSIIISPLIALMKDQVDSLNKEEIIAGFVNSTMDYKEYEDVMNKITYGKLKILFVSPERLENRDFAKRIKELSPKYLFVDEAHCISEWGHNFRPSYRKIKNFTEFISVKHISAFTATATPEVRDDIVKQLNFKKTKIFVKGFERDNLHINVIKTTKKKETTLALIKQFNTPVIIYTSSRKASEEITEYLNMHKIKCNYYHAGLRSEIRIKIQDDFQNDRLKIIAATNAFGMGIDKKDIRLIIHYNTPNSIENYYQEIGRAGRDGKDSHAYLLYEKDDMNIHNYFLLNSNPDKQLIQDVYNAVCDYGKVAVGSTNDEDIYINSDFISNCVNRKLNNGLLNSVLNTLQTSGYLKVISKYDKSNAVKINFTQEKLKSFIKKTLNFSIKELILYLIQKYGNNVFSKMIEIDLKGISKELNFSISVIKENFIKLNDLGVLNFKQNERGEYINLTTQRVSTDRLQIDYTKINSSYLVGQQKIEKMLGFVFTNECRFKYILNYFGEDTSAYTCGICDVCKHGQNISDSSTEYIKEIVLNLIYYQNNKLTENDVIKILKGESNKSEFAKINYYGAGINFLEEEIQNVISYLYSSKQIINLEKSVNKIEITEKGISELPLKTNKEEDPHKPIKYDHNLELYSRLKDIRQNTAKKYLQKPALICPEEILKRISEIKPESENALLKIEGFTKRMFNKIGADFIEEIKSFKKNERENIKLPPGINETYRLLKEGYSLNSISKIRKLSETVISMHAESIIENKKNIEINKLISEEVIKTIEHELKKGFSNLKELKERLPKEISYPMIRIAVAKFRSKTSPSP
ncbi:MAG: hypothetical protein COW08_07565 [Ignavibacteriales bacterium CG12_big_fil_rev_8_21_14_0_65_30_8]|nr:MAG: hypothetical protein COW08_07565 [Ignavibacteriales bacterium CG12_big_fil_rev_8_21_14_0_65_30_8]